MSLPPVTVHIKRKATDEPVDFLRVHETHGKRQRRAADFVFSRQAPKPQDHTTSTQVQGGPRGSEPSLQNTGLGLVTAAPTPTSIQVSNSGPSRLDDGAHIPNITATQSSPLLQQGASPSRKRPAGCDDPIPTRTVDQTRRFHMSRTPSQPLGAVPGGQVRKRAAKPQPAVFVERKGHPRVSPKKTPLPDHFMSRDTSESTHVEAEQARVQKKPGLAARSQTSNPAPAQTKQPNLPTHNVRLPSGLMMPWDVNSEQLAAEMQAYTLQEIGKNLADAAASRPGVNVPLENGRLKKPQSRFKPKKPALRYQERHPNEVLDTPSNMGFESNLSDEEMEDDAGYIIDTYVRMPADALLQSSDSEGNVGLLILDSQPDIDKFYLEDSESEEEEEDEEEDENAENHYTADYPDDEVDSDDEYDRNPYLYRTHNASDLEEFDENDATFSDDDPDDSKYPWANRP